MNSGPPITDREEESQPLFLPPENRSFMDAPNNHSTPVRPNSSFPRDSRPIFPTDIPDRPLFGVSNRRDRIVNLVVGCVTALLFLVTLVCAFCTPGASGKSWPPSGLNIYFAVCILFIFIAHIVLIHWYRQGDLDPKFRCLIYYNAFTMVLISICALSYFFKKTE